MALRTVTDGLKEQLIMQAVKVNRGFLAAGLLAALLAGCSMTPGQEDTARRTASGAGIGVAAGALVGELATGQPLHGAAIGAAAGAVGGWLYDHHKKKTETSGY
jgi:hypothetical protein